MSNAKSQTQLTPGTAFEYRVARMRFIQGYYVRRSIDVWPSTNEGQQLAELDCLSVSFDPQMRRLLEIIECKTGAGGQGEIDRILWLKGISEYAKSNNVTFAKLRVAPRTRDFARQIRVDVLDEMSLTTIERSLHISSKWWLGFHDPDFGERVVKPARIALTASVELRRAGRYLFGGFWFADDFTRVKQLRSLFRLLVDNSSKLHPDALKLGIAEATTLFTLTTLSIAAWQGQLAHAEFRNLLSQELSTGLGDPQSLRNLLRRIDDIHRKELEAIHAAYQDSGAGRIPFHTRNLETDVLVPPEWVEAYIELITRFARRPNLATNILRWTDLWASTLLGQKLSQRDYDLFDGQEYVLESGIDLVVAFLNRMWDVPIGLLGKSKVVESAEYSIAEMDDENDTPESKESGQNSDVQSQLPIE